MYAHGESSHTWTFMCIHIIVRNYTQCFYLWLDVCLLLVWDAGFHNGAFAGKMNKLAHAANHKGPAVFGNRPLESAPIALAGIPALTSQ